MTRDWDRLDTVAALKQRLLEYNPYREIEIVPGGQREPVRENYSLLKYMAGMHLRERIQRDGMQQTRAWINSHQRIGAKAAGHNAKKLLAETFADFVPCDVADEERALSVAELYERYRHSLSKQLAV